MPCLVWIIGVGNGLSTIARRNGTSVARLRSWNGLRSDRLSIGQRLVVGKRPVVTPQKQTNEVQLAQANTGGNTTTVNTYYRVRKGDTLGKIARQNNVGVSQLQSWNGLRSSRIGVADQLIVGQKTVPLPEEEADNPAEEDSLQELTREAAEEPAGDGNIISNYLKQQMDKASESAPAEKEENEQNG